MEDGRNIRGVRIMMRHLCALLFLLPLLPTALAQEVDSREQHRAEWIAFAREFLAENPDNEPLRHLVNALESVDLTNRIGPDNDLWFTLSFIREQGWRELTDEQIEILRAQTPAVREIVLFAESEDARLPPRRSLRDPEIDYLTLSDLTRLLLIDARRLEAHGDPDLALRRVIQALRVDAHLAANRFSLIRYLLAMSEIRKATAVVASVLRHPDLSEEALRQALEDLSWMETRSFDLAGVLREEMRWELLRMREAARSPESIAETFFADSYLETLRPLLQSWASHEAEYRRIWDFVIEDNTHSPWERQTLQTQWLNDLTSNEALRLIFGSLRWVTGEAFHAHTQIKLCRALALLRLGEWDPDNPVIDPFTGEGLQVSDTRVWSLGFDRVDQQGELDLEMSPEMLDDLREGRITPGDIVVER
jgi:hypothetical protein